MGYVLAILDMDEHGVNEMPYAWRLREDVPVEDILFLIQTYASLSLVLDVIDIPPSRSAAR